MTPTPSPADLREHQAVPVSREVLDELQRDAARYRLWREIWCRNDDMEAMNALAPTGFSGEDEWDAILDAARKVAP